MEHSTKEGLGSIGFVVKTGMSSEFVPANVNPASQGISVLNYVNV